MKDHYGLVLSKSQMEQLRDILFWACLRTPDEDMEDFGLELCTSIVHKLEEHQENP